MLRLTAMDAFKNMIEKAHEMEYAKRYESFFIDYSLIPLLMQVGKFVRCVCLLACLIDLCWAVARTSPDTKPRTHFLVHV